MEKEGKTGGSRFAEKCTGGETEGENRHLAALTRTAGRRVGAAHTLRAGWRNLLGGSYALVTGCFAMHVYIKACVCTVLYVSVKHAECTP